MVQKIFSQPITRIKHIAQEGLYAENTARDYLNKLAELGVVEKQVHRGNHYYLNQELYRILADYSDKVLGIWSYKIRSTGKIRNISAAVSGVMSRWGPASISYPTINFFTVAERNRGG